MYERRVRVSGGSKFHLEPITIQSTIRLEVNGRISSGKKTKHISSCFFFTNDNIAKGEVDVEYLLTEKIWCDILNNPKQGPPYSIYQRNLMNFPMDYDKEVNHKATHPAQLDTKKDDTIVVPNRTRNIPKANPNPVCKSVLGSVLEEVRWDSTQVPRQKGF